MKIALVTYWCVPYHGGVSTHILTLQQGLVQSGHEVDIFSHNADGSGYHLLASNSARNIMYEKSAILQEINEISYMNLEDPWLSMMQQEQRTFQHVISKLHFADYDLIHAHDVIAATSIANLHLTPPILTTLHGTLTTEWMMQGVIHSQSKAWHWASSLEEQGCHVSEALIVSSAWLKHTLKLCQIALQKPIHIIPYGMDVKEFLTRTSKTTSLYKQTKPSEKFVLLCPGRLDPVKGHTILLQALAQLKLLRKERDWECWLAGDGPLHDSLRMMQKLYLLDDSIMFLGHRQDLPSLLTSADIIVIPSIHDNFPHSVMEAQLAGKPIIASTAGGIPEMIDHGKTGLLFTNQNPHELAHAIHILLEDAKLRKRLGRNAFKMAKNRWSMKVMSKKIVKVYRSVLRARKK